MILLLLCTINQKSSSAFGTAVAIVWKGFLTFIVSLSLRCRHRFHNCIRLNICTPQKITTNRNLINTLKFNDRFRRPLFLSELISRNSVNSLHFKFCKKDRSRQLPFDLKKFILKNRGSSPLVLLYVAYVFVTSSQIATCRNSRLCSVLICVSYRMLASKAAASTNHPPV